MKKTNQEETRHHNSRLVLSTIYNNIEISRVDISRATGLTRTSVSEIVAQHINNGLVVETGHSPSSGGKPAILLRFDENSQVLIGIDLSESEFRGALVDLRGTIIYRHRIPLEGCDSKAAQELVYKLIEKLVRKAGVKIAGIGIGTPGLMNPNTGMVRHAINLGWKNLPLGERLSLMFDLPVHIANDCQVAALGEFTFGESTDSEHLVLIKIGSGIGAGIILNGRNYYGDSFGAGEIGHIQTIEKGELCRCGNRGCLETVASESALIRHAQKLFKEHPDSILTRLTSQPDDISINTLMEAYKEQDRWVVSLINDAGLALGGVVANLVGTMNVNRIRISGRLSCFGDNVLSPIRRCIKDGTLPGLSSQVNVAFSTLGEDIVLQGAGSMILKNQLGLM
jgi:glucokinase-like ROK family protein